MSHVPIVAASSGAGASRSADLAKHLQDTIDAYRSQHPGTKDLDVRLALRTALRHNRCHLDESDHRPLLLMAAAIILLLLLGAASFVFFANRGY
jgi:hypothetical protein